ncbi:MAG: hypothetical protein AABY32_00190 [Nanoarchaeota archaeon]
MAEINFNKNIYVYGKGYLSEVSKTPEEGVEYNLIIVYPQPWAEKERVISSLEGFFVSEIPLVKKGDKGVRKDWQISIGREYMSFFEEQYQGKFIPFEK